MGKPTGFKCVVGAYGWLESLCLEIHRRGIEHAPDFITIDSAEPNGQFIAWPNWVEITFETMFE